MFIYLKNHPSDILASRHAIYRTKKDVLVEKMIKKKKMEIIIDKTASDQRFDRFLRKWFKRYPQVKLADIYRIIRI